MDHGPRTTPSIPILDLRRQYDSIRPEIDAAIREVLESGEFILGPHVKKFEEAAAAYCHARHAIGLANGTDALLLSLKALGIGPGDAVIVPSFTFFATAGVVHNVGATPIFCDIDPTTFNLDPASARAILQGSHGPGVRQPTHAAELSSCRPTPAGRQPRTPDRGLRTADSGPRTSDLSFKAIIPVHLYGQMADMDEIMALAHEYDLAVIEDAAQAIGAQYAGRHGCDHGSRTPLLRTPTSHTMVRRVLSLEPNACDATAVLGRPPAPDQEFGNQACQPNSLAVGQHPQADSHGPRTPDFGLNEPDTAVASRSRTTDYGPRTPDSGHVSRAGSIGSVGCFSFYPTKNLGAYGDAGMVTTDSDELAERIRLLRVHGAKPKYVHHVVGINSRLDAIQAAILSVKLKHLEDWTAARQRLADRYDRLLAGLPGIVTPNRLPDRTHIFHQYTIRVEGGKRDALAAHLKAEGIGTMIYYPGPLHLQECFAHLGYRDGDFPESERASREVLSLPIFPELREEEQDRVVAAIRSFAVRGP